MVEGRPMGRRVAVVTGGASGIGRATAGRLAAEGFALAVLDVEGAGVAEAVGEDGLGIEADVADEGSVERAFSRILAELGGIDVLVNNAGITGGPQATTCHETPVEDWDRVLAVNTRGPFLCTRAALPAMLEQGSGHVITVASAAGLIAFPGRCAYTASKGAAVLFTKSLAVDYAAFGIPGQRRLPGYGRDPHDQVAARPAGAAGRSRGQDPHGAGRPAGGHRRGHRPSGLRPPRLHALVLDGGWTAL